MDREVSQRTIIHLDMDAFYPAVEVLDNPGLKGRPVIVGGSRERGVVSSASYEARKFGVHSAQAMARAVRLCPQGIFLPVRMSRYKEVSGQVFEIFYRFTPLVEPLSIDEAFLDVTGSERLFGRPVEIAKEIKRTVFQEIGLTVSAGVAPNKFVAKIASDMDKPDGLTIVSPKKIREFLDPLPISKMWGVGKKTQEALARLNIRTFRDLYQMPVRVLEQRFGKQGIKMYQLSMGIDEREVETGHQAKSVGHEQTFMEDILDLEAAKREILFLSNAVARRMRRQGVTGKTVTLKVKYSDFTQITRAETLQKPTDDGFEIYATACLLITKTLVGKKPVRLLGVSLSQLSLPAPGEQLSFLREDASSRRRKRLNVALDSVHKKHGDKGIRPGTLLR